MLLAILVNPSLVEEKRSPLRDVAVVVVDESPSQEIGDRQQATEAALAALTERLGHERDLDVRVVRAGKPQPGSGDDGTRLFTALTRAMSDMPRQRLAGGRHDHRRTGPRRPDRRSRERRRRSLARRCRCCCPGSRTRATAGSSIAQAPSFGLVGKDMPLTIRVEDLPVCAGRSGQSSPSVRRG